MMTKKGWLSWFLLIILLTLIGCSSSHEDTDIAESDTEAVSEDRGTLLNSEAGFSTSTEESEAISYAEDAQDVESDVSLEMVSDRKIIRHASIHAETSTFDEHLSYIEAETNRLNGYIVQSTSHGVTEEKHRSGTIITRIPENKFQAFLSSLEEGEMELIERSISGEDVTEQYVDLASRLDAKKVAEERLLNFMSEAKKTEDLLKISSDLSELQEEIEQLTGKIRYLENQSNYATIEIHLSEKNIEVSSVPEQSESTWQQTKEQFIKSINLILNGLSSIFIFIVGNLPIFLLVSCVFLIIWLLYKKFSKKEA